MQYRHNQAWFTFHYVSIKSDTVQPVGSLSVLFTFHYVSIKSLSVGYWDYNSKIYIPLCIY